MSNKSRIAELEALQRDNTERFALTDFRFDSIDAGMGQMESMMQSFLTKNAEDAATYATIAAMQREVADDTQELAALTSLTSPTGLAHLRSSTGSIANSIASSTQSTLSNLGSDVWHFRGAESLCPSRVPPYSPKLSANVTKCNSTGQLPTRPGMPVCTIQNDDNSIFELNSYGTSDKSATNPSAHEVNAHQENVQPHNWRSSGQPVSTRSISGQIGQI
jgi:hypothetical protein